MLAPAVTFLKCRSLLPFHDIHLFLLFTHHNGMNSFCLIKQFSIKKKLITKYIQTVELNVLNVFLLRTNFSVVYIDVKRSPCGDRKRILESLYQMMGKRAFL